LRSLPNSNTQRCSSDPPPRSSGHKSCSRSRISGKWRERRCHFREVQFWWRACLLCSYLTSWVFKRIAAIADIFLFRAEYPETSYRRPLWKMLKVENV
jgi:hypothetical protein